MLHLRRVDVRKYLDIFYVDNKKLNRTVNAFDLYLLMVFFPGILKTRNCVVEQFVFCAQQHPRGICVCVCVFWEQECFSLLNGKARPLLTVTPLCGRASSQCYCVLTRSYFHSRSVSKAGRGRNMPSDAHSWLQARPLTCVCKQPDSLIRRPVVPNNHMQQLRMSMSFPVFVRSYSVLLRKPNAILKNLYPRRLLSFFFFPSHSLPLFG